MGVNIYGSHATRYFDSEGRENLRQVVSVVRRSLSKREALRTLKLVFFTAFGEGPVLAIRTLRNLQALDGQLPKMIAVTFPPTFKVRRDNERVTPAFTKEVTAYLTAMEVTIITGRLPFDSMDGAEFHSREMETIKSALAVFGGSFPMCVQAVLQACDFGAVSEGEDVIAITGDCAAIIRASSTKEFLSPHSRFFVREFLCKPSQREWNRMTLQNDRDANKVIEAKTKSSEKSLQ